MSLTSRSSRRTSWSMTASSFSRCSSFLATPHRGHGRAQAGQRVLDLMRHVGGELLVGVDPVVERRHHAAHRHRQSPDLVRPRRRSGMRTRLGLILRAFLSRPSSAAAARSASGLAMVEASTRLRPMRHQDGDHEHLQHLLALVCSPGASISPAAAGHADRRRQTLPPVPDRRRHGEHRVALRRHRPSGSGSARSSPPAASSRARSLRRSRRAAAFCVASSAASASQTPFRKLVMTVVARLRRCSPRTPRRGRGRADGRGD